MSLELGARLESAFLLNGRDMRRSALDCFVNVAWGELTSSLLLAQSYGDVGTRAPTTDHRLLITDHRLQNLMRYILFCVILFSPLRIKDKEKIRI